MLLAAATAFFFDAVILLIFGEKQRGVPKIVQGCVQRFRYHPALMTVSCCGTRAAMIIGFILFMKFTKTGGPCGHWPRIALPRADGRVKVDRYTMIGFALGAMLAGVVGGLLVSITGVNSGIGGPISIKAFMMIMIGGAGVVSGAIAGGFILGMMESVGLTVLREYGDVTYLVIFAALMVFLAIRPMG